MTAGAFHHERDGVGARPPALQPLGPQQEKYHPIDPQRADPKFRLLGAAFPFFRLLSRLDYLMFMQEGYKMIAKAEPNPSGAPGGQA